MAKLQLTNLILIGLLLALAPLLPSLEITSDKSKSCGSESDCAGNNGGPVCRYDDDAGCIRKYASKCHLELVACQLNQNLTDYSDTYCSMDTFLCEKGFERWTIFYGHENE